ncbi:MAG: hypothetical protein GXP27_07915 [Planctomycetes bacterium]|nr:hypothetical protein [Planctomycetota bacterium]
MRSKRFAQAFDKLADAERRFWEREFLAPVDRDAQVRVRVAGVICTFAVQPADFVGWGVFRPTSARSAKLVRRASLDERDRYLQLWPQVRLILCEGEGSRWKALAAHQGDRRIRIQGLVPVRLVEAARQFEVVLSRFDGTNFWFEALDPARDPAAAAYLRQALIEEMSPAELDRPGLTPEEKAAYAVCYFREMEARGQQQAQDARRQLRDALRHAGAELVDYLDRGDSYEVTWSIGGREYSADIEKGDLTVACAGICLDGMDAQFDLTSLVEVMREAETTD